MCGRIKAYQWGATLAFRNYHYGHTTIDSAYVGGVSVTHGSPRQHIWTFAAGAAEGTPNMAYACPCDASIDIRVPPFVGEDYFCESGRHGITVATCVHSTPLTLSGMGRTVAAVRVAHKIILQISSNNSQHQLLMILRLECVCTIPPTMQI